MAISDRITVLRDGEIVDSDTAENFNREKIVKAMIGRDLSDSAYSEESKKKKLTRSAGKKSLEVENISMGSLVRNSTFSVFSGQVTGVFGLVGSGRTEMMKIIAGIIKRDVFHGGNIQLDGRYIRYRVPRTAVNDGIIYVTEDRKSEGFFENMSIQQNINVGDLVANARLTKVVNFAHASALASHWTEKLNIKATGISAAVVELSGVISKK